ncbi:family 43 glycosylhydrolase [Arcticibacter tournemirensis]|uniref:Glycosyl hydrolase n=1 Tax=Arcticibacter tournemirensis TaxID=699437 RepID=A0A4V1KIT5_9SPHI|nr:family 43 glycosylhydrolase [Arcticibacter tournemirensis]RXF71812.1 glycosyl hydrolase [Arcticibacter tournemirensis]
MKLNLFCLVFIVITSCSFSLQAQERDGLRAAPAPLFRDPVTDGAADPVVFWNHKEKTWWMLYTQRRANSETADVAYCYGNAIGIASTEDKGRTWAYRGTLNLDFENGHNTFWAPDIVFHKGKYHLFVSYIRGVHNHWAGKPRMVHYTSKDLWKWKFEGFPVLPFDNVIDPTLFQMPDGNWRMWYKGPNSLTYMAESKDLKKWHSPSKEPVIKGDPHEGEKVFRFAGSYWMLTDEWSGMRIYKSADLQYWEKQGKILDKAGKRPDDTPTGAHGDVVVVGNKAYVFYFTHPGRKAHSAADLRPDGVLPFEFRRSSIQVAELVLKDGTLTCLRDEPFDFEMTPSAERDKK